jgi:hypothetical protein
MNRNNNNIYMLLLHLRGPLLMATISLAAALPYLVQFVHAIIALDRCALVCVMLLASICVAVYDTTRLLKQQVLPRLVQKVLNRVVLDDVLRSLYDPVQGLWAMLLTCSIGNAAMYALPCSAEQRVEILQSNLEGAFTREEARSILQEPGGVRLLLPASIQQWLLQPQEMDADVAALNDSAAAAAAASTAPLLKTDEAASLAACAAARIHMAAAEEKEESSDDKETMKWILSKAAASSPSSQKTTVAAVVEANSCNSSLDDDDHDDDHHSITIATAGGGVAISTTPQLEEPQSPCIVPRRIDAATCNNVKERDARRPQKHRVRGNDSNNPRPQEMPPSPLPTPSLPSPPPPPRLPQDILGSIIMDMLRKSIREHVPVHQVLETTSVLAALLLVMVCIYVLTVLFFTLRFSETFHLTAHNA